MAHLCDTSVTYAVMVKAGAGIGLLPTYNDLEPGLSRVESPVEIDVPIYLHALSDRLAGADHVRAVFEYLTDLFPRSGFNTWSSLRLPRPENASARGYAMLFNLALPEG